MIIWVMFPRRSVTSCDRACTHTHTHTYASTWMQFNFSVFSECDWI